MTLSAFSAGARRVIAGLIISALALSASVFAAPTDDKSDLNADGIIDTADLVLFASRYLEQSFEDVDWCLVYESIASESRVYGKPSKYFQDHFKILLGFIYDTYRCDADPSLLAVVNEPQYLARMTVDLDHTGNYYISDPKVGSVFIYDPERQLIGELKNLDRPLGVAIDTRGYLLVGNDGRDNIEVYDPANGDLLATFGEGVVEMPTAITIGPTGEIYITDSRANQVWKYEDSYVLLGSIGRPGTGDGRVKFPMDSEVIVRDNGGTQVTEICIADQGNHRIKIFDMDGNFLRTLTSDFTLPSFCGCGFCPPCPTPVGTFTRLQALESDAEGRLHVLDVFDASVAILDPLTGDFLGSYGSWGDGPGLLNTPMDVLMTEWGEANVTDSDSPVIEVYAVP
ncbi:MAG TPA: NHL repeat-containing protein [Xanthomonadales bacterium]|nr:NHL repeat-containing protein [Xanthomonadales bacterium]